MSKWNISISGVSPVRDAKPDEIEMAKKFVKELEAMGHTVEEATITGGSCAMNFGGCSLIDDHEDSG